MARLGDLFAAAMSNYSPMDLPPYSTLVAALNEAVMQVGADISDSYNTAGHSYQSLPIDQTIGTAAGSNDASASKYLAPAMFHVMSPTDGTTALTNLGNEMGAVIAKYSVVTNASLAPVGAVVAEIGEVVNDASNVNAFTAVLGGDSGTTIATAAFGVRSLNSTAASGFWYGLDLQAAAIGSYQPIDSSFYLGAPLRLVSDVVFLVGAGAPVNGTTGLNVSGPGSLYIDVTGSNLYVNSAVSSATVWKLVTRAA